MRMDDFRINIDNVLIEYLGKSKDVFIPDGVTGIGDRAFKDREDIMRIEIPDGVTHIGLELEII